MIRVAENMKPHIAFNLAQWHRARAEANDVDPSDRARHAEIAQMAEQAITRKA